MSYVRFQSDASFTLGTNDNTKIWNGTASNAMEYSTNGSTWTSWSGSAAISAAATNGVYNLYLNRFCLQEQSSLLFLCLFVEVQGKDHSHHSTHQ